MTESNRIYVVCLRSFNQGKTLGGWLDLSDFSEKEDLLAAMSDCILGGDTWVIHDYEGPVASCNFGELPHIPDLVNFSNACELYDTGSVLLVQGINPQEPNYKLCESVLQLESWEEYAEECLDEGMFGDIASNVRGYIDTEKLGRDISFDYHGDTYNGTIYAIHNGEF